MSVLDVGAHAHLGVGLAPVLGVGGAAVIADAIGSRDFAGGHSSDEREGGSVLHCMTRTSRKYPLERRAGRPAVVVDVCHPPPSEKNLETCHLGNFAPPCHDCDLLIADM
jgi:hypothetical protein